MKLMTVHAENEIKPKNNSDINNEQIKILQEQISIKRRELYDLENLFK
jgi:hypothetical protein